MSRYSSDSDSSSYHRKNRRKRSRSSSSSNSDSSRRRRSKSSRHRSSSRYKSSLKNYSSRSYRRSRSKSKTSSRHSRSPSKDRRRRRSRSRDKYRHKRHYKSRSHSKGHSSKYHSRSTSSDSKNSSSTDSSKTSSNASTKKTSYSSNSVTNPEEQLREKLLKAIKAAESADHQLKQQGVLPKDVKSRNNISSLATTKPTSDVIKDINAECFVQKSFTSSKNKNEESIEEINVPNAAVDSSNIVNVDVNSIFHASFYVDPKAKMDRWVKKLFQIRQKAITGEPMNS